MTLRLALPLLLTICSCGKGKSGGGAPAQERRTQEELKTHEHAFLKDLVDEGDLTQQETLRRLLRLKELSPEILKRFDRHLSTNCQADRKECHFEWKKEKL